MTEKYICHELWQPRTLAIKLFQVKIKFYVLYLSKTNDLQKVSSGVHIIRLLA